MKSLSLYLFSFLLLLISVPALAQIGIGTTTPAASAALEVSSTANNKGILIPRLSASQKDAIASPAEGLMIFQTTAPAGFYYYTGTAWKLIMTQTDLDTKLSTVDANLSLATKVDKVSGKQLSTNDFTSAEKTKLAAIIGTNTGDQDLSSFVTTNALALKANTTDVNNGLATKVDKVSGKDLSTNDYTTTEKTKLAAITGSNTGDQDLSSLATTTSVALKANASDLTSGLATKVDKASGKDLSTNDYTTTEKTKLAAITGSNTGDQDLSALASNTALALKANAADLTSGLANKVDKETGKELSSNDYTSAEKTKLAAITGSNTGDQDLSSLASIASVALKAPLENPVFTGTPSLPSGTIAITQAPADNSTKLATTAYADAAVAMVLTSTSSGVADNSVTSAKIADGTIATADIANAAITNEKISDVAGSKITGVIPVSSGGTGETTVPGILSTLGFAGNSIAIGRDSGTPDQDVNMNTVSIGGGAGDTNQGQSAIAIGYVSGNENQGANALAIGGNTAQSNQGTQAVALGFAAGQNNQGAYSVALGSFAGNSQVANSIAINASGTTLNPANAGFYVNPVRTATATSDLLYFDTTTKEITTAAASFLDLTSNQSIGGLKTFTSTDGLLAKGTYGSGTASSIGAGTRMMWYPKKSAFRAGTITGAHWDDVNIGNYSTAMGNTTTASGDNSTAIGSYNIASGEYSTALGISTKATGFGSIAIGNSLTASGLNSYAMGTTTNASGSNSTAMGYGTTASKDFSTAIGFSTNATGYYSTAMGNTTTASGFNTTAMGGQTIASGDYSTAMGDETTASGRNSTTMGKTTIASDYASLVIGQFNNRGSNATSAYAFSATAPAFVIGNGISSAARSDAFVVDFSGNVTANKFIGDGSQLTGLPSGGLTSITENNKTGYRRADAIAANYGEIGINAVDLSLQDVASTTRGATGTNSFAAGYRATASGPSSTATGEGTIASGPASTAMGDFSIANGPASTAMGKQTTASGPSSTAMGYYSNASGSSSTAMGYFSNASGMYSTATGVDTYASGNFSTAMGNNNSARSFSETAIGIYNTDYTPAGSDSFNATDRLFVIGNGTNDAERSNALTVLKNANTTIGGSLTVNGNGSSTSYALPSVRGTSGQVLTTDGSGVTSWTTVSGGSSSGVPYTGATAAVNLGPYDLTVNGLTIGKGLGNRTNNTAIGNATLSSNTSGFSNTANGFEALKLNTSGNYNTAIGTSSLSSNTTGGQNTSVGIESMLSNTTGNGNAAIGRQSLASNTEGNYNTGLGIDALAGNTTGSYGVGIGQGALGTNTTGRFNTAVGPSADVASNNLTNATAIGNGAIVATSNTIQLGNTDVTNVKTSGTITAGAVTYPNTDGTVGQVLTANANGIPTWAAASGVPYTGATAAVNLGAFDLKVNGLTLGKGLGNIASNTVIGANAFQANTTGYDNTANGYYALNANKTGYSNTANGIYTLLSNIDGNSNTANGSAALFANTTGDYNTANGGFSLFNNTIGNDNTANGYYALYNNTEGSNNTANGVAALINTTGNNNTANGKDALRTNSTGTNNTALGYKADVASNNLTNATAIGNGAIVAASNTIQLGNADVTNVKTSGTITAGAVTYPKIDGAAGQVLTANANGIPTWAAASSGGTHTIGEAYGGGIVIYVYDNGKHGLIAATADQSSGMRWFGGSMTNTRARGDGVGAGSKNTVIIIANQAAVDGNAFAATVCNEYSVTETVGGVTTTYGDWYLPSKYELNLIYLQKVAGNVSGFGDNYFSSTEDDFDACWYQDFNNGQQGIVGKSNVFYIRAIRAF